MVVAVIVFAQPGFSVGTEMGGADNTGPGQGWVSFSFSHTFKIGRERVFQRFQGRRLASDPETPGAGAAQHLNTGLLRLLHCMAAAPRLDPYLSLSQEEIRQNEKQKSQDYGTKVNAS
jgi:hypothetical protein